MIDLHCHILPGIDDGPKTLADAHALGERLLAEGVTTVVATPHRLHLRFPDPPVETLRTLLERLRQDLGGRLRLCPGAEVRLVPEVTHLLDHRDLFLNGSRYLLVEFPHDFLPPRIEYLVFDLTSRGVIPLIAHPERNRAFIEHPERLAELIRLGCYAQSDAPSFVGDYGRRIKKTVLQWIERGLVHILASDAHGATARPPKLAQAIAHIEKTFGSDVARALVWDNPLAVIDDREIPFVFEVPVVKSFMR
jgi:protein-tyrosine phosphatase